MGSANHYYFKVRTSSGPNVDQYWFKVRMTIALYIIASLPRLTTL